MKPRITTAGSEVSQRLSVNPRLWRKMTAGIAPMLQQPTGKSVRYYQDPRFDASQLSGTARRLGGSWTEPLWTARGGFNCISVDRKINESWAPLKERKVTSNRQTYFAYVQFKATNLNDYRSFIIGNSSTTAYSNFYPSNQKLGHGRRSGGFINTVLSTITWNAGELNTVGLVTNGTSHDFWINGVKENVTAAYSISQTVGNRFGGIGGGSIFGGNMDIASAYSWAEELSDDDMLWLHNNPEGPLRMRPKQFAFNSAAAFSPFFANNATRIAGILK